MTIDYLHVKLELLLEDLPLPLLSTLGITVLLFLLAYFWKSWPQNLTSLSEKISSRLRLIILLLYFLGTSYVSHSILATFPNSADEIAYLYQADTFLEGRFWNQAGVSEGLLTGPTIFVRGERVFSQYPVGWPLVLAMFHSIGIPYWLVSPFLATLLLGALHVFISKRYSLVTADWTIAAVICSPFYLFNAASYFSHISCGLSIVSLALGSQMIKESRSLWGALMVGIGIGLSLTTRSYTAGLCIIPFIPTLITFLLHPKVLVAIGTGALPWFCFEWYYNDAITGEVLVSAFAKEYYEGKALNVLTVSEKSHNSLYFRLALFALWSSILWIWLYAWRLFSMLRSFTWAPQEWIPLVLVIGYMAFPDSAGNQYGPRYYLEAYPFLLLACAAQIFHSAKSKSASAKSESTNFHSRYLALLFVSAIGSMLFMAPFLTHSVSTLVHKRTTLFRLVEEQKLENSLVIIQGWSSDIFNVRDMTYNDPNRENSVLYAAILDEIFKRNLPNLLKRFPERKIYIYSGIGPFEKFILKPYP